MDRSPLFNLFLFRAECSPIWCPFFFLSEPNAPPSHVQGHNKSSTSILVQWGDVPPADQNGIILNYTVNYAALPNGTSINEVVHATAKETTLTGLNEYTNYSITVFASTSKGGGNVSKPIIVITDEDGKLPFRIGRFALNSRCLSMHVRAKIS